ncbi:hypothetical protein [Paenibacillus periandrae]|uniref:hypothetical protein n=1 Tax=Paenibacillus periandrae TaxID=1761741 RepID=UPI001F08E6D9|nr:hypothetical protein [Paenibacillus periandrae]
MDTEALKHFITTYNVLQRTLDGFQYYMDKWKVDDQSDFETTWENIDPNSIEVRVKKISLTINYTLDTPIEYVQAYACILNDGEEITVYHSLFTLDGLGYDDVLSSTALE